MSERDDDPYIRLYVSLLMKRGMTREDALVETLATFARDDEVSRAIQERMAQEKQG